MKLSYTQNIVMGFFLVIMLGTMLLMLPIATRERNWIDFSDAFFTATSATCVTGLMIFDTYSHWSLFGQLVILAMVQIGGIGFMTILTMFSLVIKRKIGLHERQLMVQAQGMLHLTGAVRLIKRIIFGSLIIEAVGASVLAIRFIPKLGFFPGIYNAIFLSVSAFNNAGIDLMGRFEPFPSLTYFADDFLVTLTLSVLIMLGGIGFIVWDDVLKHRLAFVKYELHTKIVLVTTFTLMLFGWLIFFILETPASLYGLPFSQRVLQTFFHSVSLRTAGFVTLDMTAISEGTALLTLILMFIGASSGSTGGGIKVTTFAVLVLSAIASARHKKATVIFKRNIDSDTVRKASAMLIIYFGVVLAMTLVLTMIEPFTMAEALFETVAAITTTGLSLGITPQLNTLSRLVITLLMFIGRIGFLTLVIALGGKQHEPPIERVTEKILIG
ncbi:MAG: Trk family potassium uptake protein [Turicibacter sp.]|nr:Trk family potassium uptake protein [Turicibacter sp.]